MPETVVVTQRMSRLRHQLMRLIGTTRRKGTCSLEIRAGYEHDQDKPGESKVFASLSFDTYEGGDCGFRYSACDLITLLEGRQTRGGIGLHPRLVLRHPTPECRRFRRHGGGGHANIAHSIMHRGIDSVQSDCSGCGQRAGIAECARPRPDSFRRRDRIYRSADDGTSCDYARATG